MQDDNNVKYNHRVLASFFLLFSFLILPVSGILIHESDTSGDFQAKHLFMTIHNSAALIFAVTAVIHAKINWKSIAAYAKKYKREMAVSAFIIAFVVIFTSLHVLATR